MSKIISREELIKLSEISNISLREDELSALEKSLEEILVYVSSLKKVEREFQDLEPAQLMRTVNVLREDVPKEGAPEDILKEAPVRKENYFVVPIIIKKK